MRRVAIVGSRDYEPLSKVVKYVMALPKNSVVISGGAIGVDRTAAHTARSAGLEVVEYLPDYAMFGKSAPLMRNNLIVQGCDRLVAFWNGVSRGTRYTVDLARNCGVIVDIIVP